jgi:hypothetical protein
VVAGHGSSSAPKQQQQRRALLQASGSLPVRGTVAVKEDPSSYPSADVDAARGDGSVYLDDNGEITIQGEIPDSVQVRNAQGGGEGGGIAGTCAGVCQGSWLPLPTFSRTATNASLFTPTFCCMSCPLHVAASTGQRPGWSRECCMPVCA